ncbi:MAG: 2-C-methyl-D-erythritol 4-phosphate cytidylyltransferase [Clostridium sp.]|nr:2-C-methyl-D-erythritol 4-phosphate cytidylyltransferase [Clostridium sp.]
MGKIAGIVLAAGKGSRMHSDVAKQFLELRGRPVLYYSLQAFEESSVDEIVLVTGAADVAYCKEEMIKKYHFNKVRAVVEGGSERYWSVKNGLQAVRGADYVLIHDAARPCVTQELIERSIIEVINSGACTVGVPVKDTIKVVDSLQYGIDTPDRNTLWQIQTPQSFRYQEIISAYEKMEQSGDTDITDDTMIIERYLGKKTRVIPGDYRNLKITTQEDLAVAEIFLEK